MGSQYNLLTTAFALLLDDIGSPNYEGWNLVEQSFQLLPSKKSVVELKQNASQHYKNIIDRLNKANIPYGIILDNLNVTMKVGNGYGRDVYNGLVPIVLPLPSIQFNILSTTTTTTTRPPQTTTTATTNVSASTSLPQTYIANEDLHPRHFLPSLRSMLLFELAAANYIAKALDTTTTVIANILFFLKKKETHTTNS